MKRHEKDGWHVYSEKGKHMGGPYKSEGEASHRLQQIEYFKHRGKKAEVILNELSNKK